jgi:hypothetical protein
MNKAALFTANYKGVEKTLILLYVSIDEIEEALLTFESYKQVALIDETMTLEISRLEMQRYMDFYLYDILADGGNEIPFFISLTDNCVLDPEEAYLELLGPTSLMKDYNMKFHILNIYYDGKYQDFNVCEMSFKFVDSLLAKKDNSVDKYDFPFITMETLEILYNDFKSQNLSQKYFLLAVEFEKDIPVGYVVESSIDNSIAKTYICKLTN